MLKNHKWVCSLNCFGIKKVCVYNSDNNSLDRTMNKILSLSEYDNPPFPQCLVTYLGFWFNPSGLFFRSLQDKYFHCQEFFERKLIYYVSENFEKNLKKFKYGDLVVLLEGVLDVEAFSYLLKYPYVIGYMTSYVRPNLAAVLSTLTNKFLIIPDNDDNDQIERCTKKSIKNFNTFGVNPSILKTESKDFGEVYNNTNLVDINKSKFVLESILKGEENGI